MGLGSSKPETKYLPEFEEKLSSLEGKTVAITGTTSGTGLVAAKVSVRKGVSNLLLLNRSSERATTAEAEIKAEIKEGQKTVVETVPCDLQDFASVKNAADTIKSKYKSLDVLVNNAGIMAMDDKATKDGYDVQMQTNHLSHFLLTKELFPLLKASGDGRVVNHSSIARNGKPLDKKYLEKNGGNLGGNGSSMLMGGGKWERYHQSKLANAVYTLALKDKLDAAGITSVMSVCAAPGYSVTNLQTSSQGMGGAMWLQAFAQSAEDGTMPLLQAAYGTTVASGDFIEPANKFHMAGPAVKVELSKECTDPDSRTMLWEASEEACGAFTFD